MSIARSVLLERNARPSDTISPPGMGFTCPIGEGNTSTQLTFNTASGPLVVSRGQQPGGSLPSTMCMDLPLYVATRTAMAELGSEAAVEELVSMLLPPGAMAESVAYNARLRYLLVVVPRETADMSAETIREWFLYLEPDFGKMGALPFGNKMVGVILTLAGWWGWLGVGMRL
jgi:hypothetical protein